MKARGIHEKEKIDIERKKERKKEIQRERLTERNKGNNREIEKKHGEKEK